MEIRKEARKKGGGEAGRRGRWGGLLWRDLTGNKLATEPGNILYT